MSRFARLLTRFAVLTVMLIVGGTPYVLAQAGADDEPFRPGLLASYSDVKGSTASRIDHQLAFHWGEAAPDPRLTAGEFRATWQGRLSVEAEGDYRFFVFGTGEVELKVAGRVAVARQIVRNGWCESPPMPLTAELQPFELSFRRTENDARLMVLWSGPQFGLEPIPPRLLVHARERTAGREFEHGQLLSRVLRCGRCHGDDQAPPAPALDRLAGNVSRDWLVRWLVAGEHAPPNPAGPASPRRMPAFGLSDAQAETIADWLLTPRPPDAPPAPEKKPTPTKTRPSARAGEQHFLTLGCLACHTWRDLGASGWLGGGDLTHVADKRPPGFFAAWLADPARLNRDHRMPVFSLSDDERTSLALFLAEQKPEGAKPDFGARDSADRRAEGRKLGEQFHCGACHRLPEAANEPPQPKAPRLGEQSHWDRSCSGAPDAAKHRPGYRLGASDANALRRYYTSRRAPSENKPARPDGRLVLMEHNCLACHEREGTREGMPLLPPLLADKLTAVAQSHSELATLVPALTPPALNSVGDKLTDSALADAIARRGDPHRPYLRVRMPRFPLRDEELQALVQYLAATDRVPERGTTTPTVNRSQQDRYTLAGGRLVSSDGFGCTSCHQVGSVQPSQAPLNARGPDLALLERRIRRDWFDRFVRNPSRIVPRMEMPSVQIPVSGVLSDRLDAQLTAVWHVLNLPGFEPPQPNPIRVLRHSGHDPGAVPMLMTDILQHGGGTLIKPFLVGLANRHNVLFDLDTARLALWTVGDAARQRTKGKTWFWELGGTTVLDPGISGSDLALTVDGRELTPHMMGQFVTEADTWQTNGPGLALDYRLRFGETTTAHVRRTLTPLPDGFAQELSVGSLPGGARVRLQVLSPRAAAGAKLSADGRTIHLGDRFSSRITLREPAGATFAEDKTSVMLTARVMLHYQSEAPIDRFPELPLSPPVARKGEPVEVAPGVAGERLPLPADIMPSGLAWRPDGRLVFCTLKGQVYEAVDTDGDGGEDRLTLLADGLPTPYGVHAGPGYVDVSAKYALLRVWDAGKAGRRVEAIASGWGYTPDYHDWAVGLPKNDHGEYFLGIPCQQDKRSPVAAQFHGSVLRLVPREPTTENPRRFTLEPISAGHRFPMGLALDRTGELFVTDNQGNYNPFNELNHVRPGAHFGFINALDKGKLAPPLTPPAIDIPHPWTRSVNGICFLDTPKELRAKLGRDVFGPLEGHLIGCEYDTRRLVRLSLQRVGDTFQGAAYPLSILPADLARGFLGPVVCAVSPRGELYVGSLRDSGWGAGNNAGEVVRVRVEPDKLACGVAEVRATRDGFVIDFTRPINSELAGRAESYTVQSYRRESTPAYGGPDRDRRTETVAGVAVAEDGRRVTLRLAELRPGFVYEFRLKNLTPGGGTFYPAEAHYTLRVVPK
jgi:mono/diheme cytochrome c family protein